MVIQNKRKLEEICKNSESIGLLSGSFNPPHSGHVAIVSESLKNYVSTVLVFPHSHNPNKKDVLIPLEHRIEMLKTLLNKFSSINRIHLAIPPIFNGVGKYEIDLINYSIAQATTDCELWIIGDYKRINETYFEFKRGIPHIVHNRGKLSDKAILDKVTTVLNGKVRIMPNVSKISSSDIRRGKTKIDNNLRKYILKNNSYPFWDKT